MWVFMAWAQNCTLQTNLAGWVASKLKENIMKLVTFTFNAVTRIGVLKENNGKTSVIDLSQIDPSIPRNMIKFLEEGD